MADKQFDVSPDTLKKLDLVKQKRDALKKEYWKQITNPYRHASMEGGTLFDAGVQRFMSLRVTNYDHFKPTPKAAFRGLALIFIPMALYTYAIKAQRDSAEKSYRTGQVAYKDRRHKFI